MSSFTARSSGMNLILAAEAMVKGKYFIDHDPAVGHSCEARLLATPQVSVVGTC